MTTSLPISPPLFLPEGAKGGASNKELELGQIVFGKVLRVQQDGSYQVDILGRQHVVDSATPLKQDEVFRGKIVGLAEHVVLEKMVSADVTSPQVAPATMEIDVSDQRLADNIKAFVAQHKKTFDVSQWNQLLRVANQNKQPLLVLTAAVYLQKLGITFNPVFAGKLSQYLAKENTLKPLLAKNALHLSSAPQSQVLAASHVGEVIQAVADHLLERSDANLDEAREILGQGRAPDAPLNSSKDVLDGERDQHSEQSFNQALLQWLMNSQIAGSTSHRMVVLPLVVDGKLVELEMSLLDQNKQSEKSADLKNKLIHFSLNTEHLGKVSATINAVNTNLRIHFSAASDDGLQMLAAHHGHLSKQLEALNHRVDELSYDRERPATENKVTKPILDFVIKTDSLSVLV